MSRWLRLLPLLAVLLLTTTGVRAQAPVPPVVAFTTKLAPGWFIEENLTHPHITVHYHWGLQSKFIVRHAAGDVLAGYALKDVARLRVAAVKDGFRCTKVSPIAGVPRSAAFTKRHKEYLNARIAYREFTVYGRTAVIYFYGSWNENVHETARRDFDQMVRDAKIRLVPVR